MIMRIVPGSAAKRIVGIRSGSLTLSISTSTVRAVPRQVTEPADDDGAAVLSGLGGVGDGEKGLYDQAVDVVAREGKASTSFIQRHLNIGYNRAAKLIEQMEKEGVVGAANHVGKREVLVRRVTDED